MFRRTRERFERLERQLEELIRAISEKPEKPVSPDAMSILATALGAQTTGQAEMFKAFGDIAVKSVARRNGIRGGTKRAATAERRANGTYLPKRRAVTVEPQCHLCEDPYYPHVTIAMIEAHRVHEQMRMSHMRAVVPGSNRDTDEEVEERYEERGNTQSGSPGALPNGNAQH